ncbi:unnamed protein product [Schistosoma guineensis]|nr:unnamed protein product [Schistosoma guineensis]
MSNATITCLLIVLHILCNDRVHFVNVAGEVEYLIYPNGKMSIYFENMPVEFNATVLESWIDYRHRCIDNKMNKSCYMEDSKETCLSASKVTKTCHWCLKVNKCTNGLDRHAGYWIAKECHTAVSNHSTQ